MINQILQYYSYVLGLLKTYWVKFGAAMEQAVTLPIVDQVYVLISRH